MVAKNEYNSGHKLVTSIHHGCVTGLPKQRAPENLEGADPTTVYITECVHIYFVGFAAFVRGKLSQSHPNGEHVIHENMIQIINLTRRHYQGRSALGGGTLPRFQLATVVIAEKRSRDAATLSAIPTFF